MGYTHYWTIPSKTEAAWKKIWPLLVSDARIIVHAAGVRLRKSIDGDAIDLNGRDYPHEGFILTPSAKDSDSCKTARKDYDICVSAILLRASQLAGEAIEVRYVGGCALQCLEVKH